MSAAPGSTTRPWRRSVCVTTSATVSTFRFLARSIPPAFRQQHTVFAAKRRTEVDAFHAAALKAGNDLDVDGVIREADGQGSYEMADDYSRLINVLGLVCNFAGVLILFRWGMPFRTASGGISLLALDGLLNEKGVALDRIYMVCGYVGLVLLMLGTMLQIIAALMPPTDLPK